MLPRSSTKAFETNPALEFDHFLAQKLGMLVADLRERMSAQEFLAWEIYYARKAQREEMEMLKAKG